MKAKIPAISVIAISMALTGCWGSFGSSHSDTLVPTVTISPHVTSIAAGSSVTFTATVTNGSVNSLSWLVFNPGEATVGNPTAPQADVGSPERQQGGTTFVYTAPAKPPVYINSFGAIDDSGTLVQGTISLSASLFYPIPGKSAGTAGDGENIVITAPSVSVGVSNENGTAPTVAVGKTIQLIGYAVGSTNNAVTWQINGVTGGSVATGTIVHTSSDLPERVDYTAPSAIPMTGNTVTATVVSQADPTKTASIVITITPQ